MVRTNFVLSTLLRANSLRYSYMNCPLLAVMLCAPSAVLAQQVVKDRLLEKLDSIVALDTKPPVKPVREIGSFSLLYREGYIIAQPAFLYRNLTDAQRGRYAHHLRPGDEVFDTRQSSPNSKWLRVARNTYFRDSIPSSDYDTTVYYLRASAVRSKSGRIRMFTLH